MVLCCWFAGCGDDDDDDGGDADDDADGPPDPKCQENSPPELLAVTVVVNGEPVDLPVTIQSSDTLEFRIEYADAECNLEGGDAGLVNPGEPPSFEFIGPAGLPGIGCSSEAVGAPYTLTADPAQFLYLFGIVKELAIADYCGEGSQRIALDITTAPPE
jgi:hypothetical protein